MKRMVKYLINFGIPASFSLVFIINLIVFIIIINRKLFNNKSNPKECNENIYLAMTLGFIFSFIALTIFAFFMAAKERFSNLNGLTSKFKFFYKNGLISYFHIFILKFVFNAQSLFIGFTVSAVVPYFAVGASQKCADYVRREEPLMYKKKSKIFLFFT